MAKRTPAQQKQFEAAEAVNREQYGEDALPEDQVDTKLTVQSGNNGHQAEAIGGEDN